MKSEPRSTVIDRVRKVFEGVNREHLKTWVRDDDPTFDSKLDFSVSRFETGTTLVSAIGRDYPHLSDFGTAVLDLGGGNGGVLLPFAIDGSFCVSFDLFVHSELLRVVYETGLTVSLASGVGEALPFDDGSFDIVLYIETIEHVQNARSVGREIGRVLKPGGVCLITTPPRLKFAFRGDPHYGVRGIVLLPNICQKWIVEQLARKGTTYEVSHLYWTVQGIMSTFPDLHVSRVYSSTRWPFQRWIDWDMIAAIKS